MNDNIARNMLNIRGKSGIINCSTQLHLVCHFCKNETVFVTAEQDIRTLQQHGTAFMLTPE